MHTRSQSVTYIIKLEFPRLMADTGRLTPIDFLTLEDAEGD